MVVSICLPDWMDLTGWCASTENHIAVITRCVACAVSPWLSSFISFAFFPGFEWPTTKVSRAHLPNLLRLLLNTTESSYPFSAQLIPHIFAQFHASSHIEVAAARIRLVYRQGPERVAELLLDCQWAKARKRRVGEGEEEIKYKAIVDRREKRFGKTWGRFNCICASPSSSSSSDVEQATSFALAFSHPENSQFLACACTRSTGRRDAIPRCLMQKF